MKKVLLAACVVTIFSGFAFARDGVRRSDVAPRRAATSMTASRMGLGFNTQLSAAGVSSIALRYWTSDVIGIEGIFGFSFGDDRRYLDLGGKILGAIRKEQNMIIYWTGLLGMENSTVKVGGTDVSDTAVTVGGGLGTEFFLPGLPNLGFGAEIGLAYNSGAKSFSTTGSWLSNVGIRYYFQ